MPAGSKSIVSADYRLFLEMLIAARHCAGLSQQALAERLNKPQSFVSKYERGERRLDFAEFIRICDVLPLDPVGFLSTYNHRRADHDV